MWENELVWLLVSESVDLKVSEMDETWDFWRAIPTDAMSDDDLGRLLASLLVARTAVK